MSQETKILLIIGLLTVVLIGGAVFLLSKNQPATSDNSVKGVTYQIDYSKGEKNGSDSAKVKLVEFADFQCPACRAVAPYVEQLISTDGSKIQVIYRYFPLSSHVNSRTSANAAASAAEQGHFWEMEKKLFESQDQWANLSDPSDFFAQLATQIGIDGQKVKDAVKNNTYGGKIQADYKEGLSLGVNATPTFFLDGRKLELTSFNDIKISVEQAIQAAGANSTPAASTSATPSASSTP